MQKAYIGKQTNSICQLIPDTYERFENYNEDTFGDMYYMVIIPDGKHLDSHDYFYNPYDGTFEPIEGIRPRDHEADVEESKVEMLEEENKLLRERMSKIESMLGVK
ncbi:MAG: hypothetical protein E7C49_11650 [Clostridium sp.]|nr:hypothetical protein [Clostridium sp.]